MMSEIEESTSENIENIENAKEKTDDENLIKDGRNAMYILCQRCQSKIIQPGKAVFVLQEHFVPYMKPKSGSNDAVEGEVLPKFWQVDDMYTFENIGFSNTIGKSKYLTCADCEIGPIGMFDIESQKSYVAIDRVHYR